MPKPSAIQAPEQSRTSSQAESVGHPEPASAIDPWLRVARIVRPQGHKGEVIADLLTDFPERFATQTVVQLRAPGATIPSRPEVVERYRLHGNRIVFMLAGCTSMNDAETLRGYDVVIPWEQRTPLADDEVYIAELTGCTLIDTSSGETVGTIVDVDQESSNTALLVIETEAGTELLVPYVKAYAPRLDLAARTLRMALPAGLLELQQPGAMQAAQPE